MPVDVRGINSILQAFLQSYQLGMQGQKEKADREQQLKLQENQFKQQEKLQKAQQTFLKSQLDTQLAEQKHRFEATNYLSLLQAFGGGKMPVQRPEFQYPDMSEQVPGMAAPPDSALGPPGDQTVDVMGTKYTIPKQFVRTPEQALALDVNRAGAIANATVPSRIAAQEPKLRSDEYQAELAGLVHLLTDQMSVNGQSKINAQELYDAAMQAATGKADLPGGAIGVHAGSILAQAGMSPFTTKQSEKLAEMHGMDSLVQLMNEFYSKHLKGKQDAGAMWNTVAANVPLLPTEIKKDFAQITGQAGNISRAIGGERGVLTQRDIERALGLLVRPGITDDQAADILNDFKQMINGRIVNQVLAKYSPSQKKMILESHGFDLSRFKAEKGDKTFPMFTQMNGYDVVYNPSSGTYQSYEPPQKFKVPEGVPDNVNIFDIFKAMRMNKDNKKAIIDSLLESTTGVKKTSKIEGFNLDDYATDPNWETGINSIRDKTKTLANVEEIDKYIKSVAPSSPITAKMVMDTAAKHNIPVDLLLSIMQHESVFGTEGRGARTFNPGNVGNFDNGKDTNMGDWSKGVDAIGAFVSKRRKNA